MPRMMVTIETPDGSCEASLFRPTSTKGPWPAVVMFMDGIGIRPALFAIAERIADHGYVVFLPDLFYRAGPYTAPDPAKLFGDLEFRQEWFKKFGGSATQANVISDMSSFLAYLDARDDVKGPKIGTTGYCMGGMMSLVAAGHFPDRVAAAASFHGSRLATDAADSPHLLAPKMQARVYVAGAIEDAGFPDDQKKRLDDALTAANVDHTVVTYPAKHGWVPSDTPVHDPAAADRHYEALFALLDGALR